MARCYYCGRGMKTEAGAVPVIFGTCPRCNKADDAPTTVPGRVYKPYGYGTAEYRPTPERQPLNVDTPELRARVRAVSRKAKRREPMDWYAKAQRSRREFLAAAVEAIHEGSRIPLNVPYLPAAEAQADRILGAK